MKYQLSNFRWGLMLFSVAFLFQVGCIPESTDPSNPPELSAAMEKSITDPQDFPLENLRMDPTTLKMLADLRAATAKYHDIAVAEAAGYEPVSPCVSHPEMGAMGIHYGNAEIIDGTYDPTQPEALLYEMDKNGNMKLVGVEFIVIKAAWDANHAMIPYFGTREFDTALAPYPLPFDNYQLHVWVWRHNPSGMFTKFNPNVTCL
jgi:hypothetical protein